MLKNKVLKKGASFSPVYFPGIFILLLALLTGCPAASNDDDSGDSNPDGVTKETTSEPTDRSNTVIISGLKSLTAEYDNEEINLQWTNTEEQSGDSIKITWSSANGAAPENVLKDTETFSLSGLDTADWYTVSIVAVDSENNESAPVTLKVDPQNISSLVRTCFILSPEDLNAVRGGVEGYDNWKPDGSYIQLKDLDISEYTSWVPITLFSGTYEGNGNTITGLTIDRPTSNNVGLFGIINEAEIKNVKIKECTITGKDCTGGIAGYARTSAIENCSVSGSITGKISVGGIAGNTFKLTGLKNCFVSADIIGQKILGALIGYMDQVPISDSYAAGTIKGSVPIGGLVGYSSASSEVTNCYATCTINEVESTEAEKDVENSLGGFVGKNFGTISNCFYDTLPTPATTQVNDFGAKVSGETMQQKETFAGWDFVSVWDIDPNKNGGYPFLRSNSPF